MIFVILEISYKYIFKYIFIDSLTITISLFVKQNIFYEKQLYFTNLETDVSSINLFNACLRRLLVSHTCLCLQTVGNLALV